LGPALQARAAQVDLSIVDVTTAAAACSGLQHGSLDVALSVSAHAAVAEVLLATVRSSQLLCGRTESPAMLMVVRFLL
jgi:hypothetical protein